MLTNVICVLTQDAHRRKIKLKNSKAISIASVTQIQEIKEESGPNTNFIAINDSLTAAGFGM
jgi:hypothetical protein